VPGSYFQLAAQAMPVGSHCQCLSVWRCRNFISSAVVWSVRLIAHCRSPSRSPKIGTGDALDDFYGIAVEQDGSVILAGDIDDDFYVTKLDAKGVVEWSFQVRFTTGSRGIAASRQRGKT